MTLQSAPTSTHSAEDRPEPPFPVALVEEMLRMFGRAVRAHQLYLHNNPTYLRALDSARAAFAPIWGHTDELVIEVTVMPVGTVVAITTRFPSGVSLSLTVAMAETVPAVPC